MLVTAFAVDVAVDVDVDVDVDAGTVDGGLGQSDVESVDVDLVEGDEGGDE